MDALAGKPWNDFLESKLCSRYLQWKHLESNLQISKESFDIFRILVTHCAKHEAVRHAQHVLLFILLCPTLSKRHALHQLNAS